MFIDWLLSRVLERVVSTGNLEVITPKSRHQFGDGRGPRVVARFHDDASVRAFLIDPDLKLGELFMEERLTIEAGSIYDLLYVLLWQARGQRAPLWSRLVDGARHRLRRLVQQNLPARSRRNVAHHYDLDERLYRLFLDEDMQYSCAYFESEAADLEAAQLAKKRHIAAKLLLEPRHHVLDIGCGWGGLGIYLSSVAGVARVVGATLSESQLQVARRRAAEIRADQKIEFELADYREIKGSYNRIVSVGMFEHVGVGYYDAFFSACDRLLTLDGVMLLHTIGCSGTPGFVMPWLNKYIFPGAYVPSMSEIVPIAERRGFMITDIEILQGHYALTLRKWRENFLRRRREAVALYDERFCRMWEFYLAAGEVAFRCEDVNIFQIQLTKAPGVTPLTRTYIAERESKLREIELRQSSAITEARSETAIDSARAATSRG